MNSQLRRSSLLLLALATVLTAAVSLYSLSPRASAAPLAPDASAWSDSLAEYGMPSAPSLWQPSNFDVQIHTRDMENSGDRIDTHAADHGADCAAPPATHSINTWQQSVYICHSHVMTAIADEGYGEVVLTPDHLADWSNGPVTIGFSVSTQRTTARDWITIDISPFAEQLSVPFDFGDVDMAGMPAHYIELNSDMGAGGVTEWRMVREQSGNSFGQDQGSRGTDGIPPSAVTRTPYEMVISKTGYIFRVGASSAVNPGKVILSGNWSKPLTFTSGVVQFAHHSYNPTKCDVVAIKCVADTWHWSDFSISNAIPYTLLRPTDHQVVTGSGGVVTFPAPAPAGSFLKFAAIGTVQVSYDGGATYSAAKKALQDPGSSGHEEHFANYMTPVPPGASSVRFKLAGGWFGAAMARDFSIISLTTAGGAPPTPTPTVPPTATVTPSPIATASPTPSPTSTPSPAPTPTPQPYDGPCTVIIDDQPVSGVCHGTFDPLP